MTTASQPAIWFSTAHNSLPALDRDLDVPIVIIGGGLMGLTAALELARAGQRAILLERRWIGAGETGHTTAHVTARPDMPMADLVSSLGVDRAAQVWSAMAGAVDHLKARSEQLNVPFCMVDAWLLGRDARLRSELEALLGVGASAFIGPPPAPLPRKQGLCVRAQARFDVAEYLRAIAAQAQQLGAQIFEGSAVTAADGNCLTVSSALGEFTVSADRVIVATHAPVFANPLLLDRLEPTQSYAIAVAVPSGSAPDVLCEDDQNPYHYYRLERGATRGHANEDIVIFGGEDHATGQPAKGSPFSKLQSTLQTWLPNVSMRPLREWSGELWTVADGLPIIGTDDQGRYFGTGFAGVGMTQATLAGLMATEWARGRAVPWHDLFTPKRFSVSEVPGFIQRGAGFVANLIGAGLPHKLPSPDSLEPGQGQIVRGEAGKAAAYRPLIGSTLQLESRCTHAGCELVWNALDSTWDCGCHGSRFTASGEVRSGPALTPMKPLE